MRFPSRHHRTFLKIGELAELLSTTPRTIRLYEELGILSPERTKSGTRIYARKEQKRLEVALKLAQSGIGLHLIRHLATTRNHCKSGAEASSTMMNQLVVLQEKIRADIERLNNLDHDIEAARNLIRQCHDCPNRPNRVDCPQCPVDEDIEHSDIARLIWDPDRP